ncbi:MAG: ribosome silencing factor [Chloroflexi bacterium]|nr:ribosome silencing factor [Chloroflexota bacterium]
MNPTTSTAPEGHLLNAPAELARRIVDLLADRQAEDVLLLDIRQVASFADYFVIATAINNRQMRALVELVDTDLREEDIKPHHREGGINSGWILVDYGAIILHIFSPELREHYALEELWKDATEVVRIQ